MAVGHVTEESGIAYDCESNASPIGSFASSSHTRIPASVGTVIGTEGNNASRTRADEVDERESKVPDFVECAVAQGPEGQLAAHCRDGAFSF